MTNLTPFDYAKSINNKTARMITEDDKGFSGYIINKLFSNTQDSVYFANEVNQFGSNISNQMLYDFYYHGLPRASRYGKWHKENKEYSEDLINYVQDYFNYNRNKAISTIKMLPASVIEEIMADIEILKNPFKKYKVKKK